MLGLGLGLPNPALPCQPVMLNRTLIRLVGTYGKLLPSVSQVRKSQEVKQELALAQDPWPVKVEPYCRGGR